MKRALSPHLNPTGLTSAAAAIYAVAVMIVNAYHHHGILDPQVIVAALAAVAALLTRQVVTPVGDPKDGNGNPLTSAPPAPALTTADLDAIAEQAVRRALVNPVPLTPSVTTAQAPVPPAAAGM
jgi:hypothetical protein